MPRLRIVRNQVGLSPATDAGTTVKADTDEGISGPREVRTARSAPTACEGRPGARRPAIIPTRCLRIPFR